jgi:DNA-directed RNA polymerase I, II, and III subunit RPABC1
MSKTVGASASALSTASAAKEDKEQSSSVITAIYKSRVVLLNLLKRQGFLVDNYEGAGTHEIHTMKGHDQLDMLITNGTEGRSKRVIYIKYAVTQKLMQRDIHNIVEDLFVLDQALETPENDTLIIVTKYSVNDAIVQLLNQLWVQSRYFIVIFTLDQLQFNILEHQYVPKHEILTEEQADGVLRRYNVTSTDQLPNISRYDPVAQAIGIRPGQICKITRPSKTSIISDYYRICT